MTNEDIDDTIERAAEKPDPVVATPIYYMRLEFSTPAISKMVEFDCNMFDRRDRELIPQDWSIEVTNDYLGTSTITFTRDDDGMFDPEEVERVRKAIEEVEKTYWLMTRKQRLARRPKQ